MNDTDRLITATATRQFHTRLEKQVALALARKAIPRPHAIGVLTVPDGAVPLEARIRLWLPLDIMADYGNADIRCGLILLRQRHFLADTYDHDVWQAVISPLLVPPVDEQYRLGPGRGLPHDRHPRARLGAGPDGHGCPGRPLTVDFHDCLLPPLVAQRSKDMTTTHELKTEQPYFDAVLDGSKPFEIRRDDRNFRVGDALILREWDGKEYSGRCVDAVITYMTDFAQAPRFWVLGIALTPTPPITGSADGCIEPGPALPNGLVGARNVNNRLATLESKVAFLSSEVTKLDAQFFAKGREIEELCEIDTNRRDQLIEITQQVAALTEWVGKITDRVTQNGRVPLPVYYPDPIPDDAATLPCGCPKVGLRSGPCTTTSPTEPTADAGDEEAKWEAVARASCYAYRQEGRARSHGDQWASVDDAWRSVGEDEQRRITVEVKTAVAEAVKQGLVGPRIDPNDERQVRVVAECFPFQIGGRKDISKRILTALRDLNGGE